MLVLCHLFIGALLGLLIYRWKGEALAVPVAAVAAILPDLIDKPLGHLLLQETLDNGRIFGHSLLFVAAAAGLAGAVVWNRHRYVALALLAGLLSHLALDAMWLLPTTLFWPLLGPFTPEHYPDYFGGSVVSELTAPSEYVFLAGLALIGAAMWRDRLGPRLRRAGDAVLRHRRVVYVAMLALGAFQVALAALAFLDDPVDGQNEVVLATALLMGAVVLSSLDPLERIGERAKPA